MTAEESAASLRRLRSAKGHFAPMDDDLRFRVSQLEARMAIVEGRTCLLKGVSIGTNLDRWFRGHQFLSTLQFTAELTAIEPTYSGSAIRTAIYRAHETGRLVRLRDGLYREALTP